jgi:hypothetical protein
MKPIDYDLFKIAFEQLIQDNTFHDGRFEHGREILQAFDKLAQEQGRSVNEVAYDFFIGDWKENEAHYLEKLKEEGISRGDIERANKRYSDRE